MDERTNNGKPKEMAHGGAASGDSDGRRGAHSNGDGRAGGPSRGHKSLIPAVSLPSGGGAIHGMGEKFGVNAVTGTSSLSVPLGTTPGRAGGGPHLELSYNSGSGNGVFGFGWSLSLPEITRKTDKGLPRYMDGEEGDVFLLSGAEDLVPVLNGTGQRVTLPVRTLHGVQYDVRLYRPRIEGMYARIERWTERGTGISHWRTITRENVISLFGMEDTSRVANPADKRQVFRWHLSQVIDNHGNGTLYQYVADDGTGVDRTTAHEANRTDDVRKTQRYLKRIFYGNGTPYFPDWSATADADVPLPAVPADWHFQVVFDYGDHAPNAPAPAPDRAWGVRPEAFSSYRAGFEVRTYRRCERVLMFHSFPAETAVGANCLVHSTDFLYSDEVNPADPTNPNYTFLASVTQHGYRKTAGGGGPAYDQRATPPLEFTYSQPEFHPEVLPLTDPQSLGNLPEGIDGGRFRWVDLDGEGLSGVLTEGDGGWSYKRNFSPLNIVPLANGERVPRVQLGPLEAVGVLPSGAQLGAGPGGLQLMDVTGEGRPELVNFSGPVAGFYERTEEESWEVFKAFKHLPEVDWGSPDLQFVDVTGNGLADILITADDVFTLYPSLGAEGFGQAERVWAALDEAKGPHVVLADGTQTVSLADMTGDGLRDIVRVRNGEVCYWTNLGYGRFGAKVVMDGAPRWCAEEQFDARRVRLADIDGSGTADLVYIGADGVHACFNQSGNSYAARVLLAVFPSADALSSVQVMDLLGTGTACLVWSSPLAGAARRAMFYVDLMGAKKPHLLLSVKNNLGAETRVRYAPSTQFYLQDKFAGRPWVTRLPFPVQCVARVETYDWVGRSRHVARYAYHHGYFDGPEREFRGFAMVEQWDTEEHRNDELFPDVDTVNEDAESWTPPVLTRSWFHTGALVDAAKISKQFAHEYWIEPGMRGDDPASVAAREALLLPDSVLADPTLHGDALREAVRALKAAPLRVEVYAEDGTARAANPYSVEEHNYTVEQLQPGGPNKHGVYRLSSRETVNLHYERQDNDPRITHEFVLDVDDYGEVRHAVSVGYGRRPGYAEPEPALSAAFRGMLAHDQTRLHVGASENQYTQAVPLQGPVAAFHIDAHRGPMPCESISSELTGFAPAGALFRFNEINTNYQTLWTGAQDIAYEEVSTPDVEGIGMPVGFKRRIVARTRMLYRSDDLTGLLPLGTAQAMALPGESYQLALTTGLISRVFGALVNDPLLQEGGYVRLAGQNDWWIPSGRVYFSAGDADSAAVELSAARAHFYQVRRAVDPFGAIDRISYDAYDLMGISTTDPVGNLTTIANDYRVLHPYRTTDDNGNSHEVAYDCLGVVAGTAVYGANGEGDSLAGFVADLTDAQILALRANPLANPDALLGNATSRIVHDLFAYYRTRALPAPDAPMVYTLLRETHVSDLPPGGATNYQHIFAYWDGFGREAQHKARAEAGPVAGVGDNVNPRWVGSGWTIYNNKGKAVRQYEPFFTATHLFEFNRLEGVSSVMFYDPAERLVAALHPDQTLEKHVFDAWREAAWDANDMVLVSDPRTDTEVGNFFLRLLGPGPGVFTSWHDLRIGGNFGPTADEKAANQDAAQKTEAHAATPTVQHFDALGRVCLGVADNGVVSGVPQRFATRTAQDTESKPLALFDALGRHTLELCLREPTGGGGFRFVAGYSLAGSPLYRNSMDGGARWSLENVAGNPMRNWDARGFIHRPVYDALQRPTHAYIGRSGSGEILTERLIYGEGHPEAGRYLKGRLFRHYDGAGVAEMSRHDFKGNVIASSRQLSALTPPARQAGAEGDRYYQTTVDWSPLAALGTGPVLSVAALDAAAAPLLVASDKYVSASRFDALNRPIQSVLPHAAAGKPSVVQPAYNEAGLLETVDVWVRAAAAPAALLNSATADEHAITNVDYNAHGKHEVLEYGNGSRSEYRYDPLTWRVQTVTTRPHPNADARTVQALSYTYDPVGNVTRLRDDADLHDVVFFSNQRVDPTLAYTYDPTYRLVRATGREHLGQGGGGALLPSVQTTNDDGVRMTSAPGMRLINPSDGKAMGRYIETYSYDAVGNFLQMVHQVASGGWTRGYAYQETSRTTPSEISNRLSATSLPGDGALGPFSAAYTYDAHGSMTAMPHLPVMSWDEQDRLQSTTRQRKVHGGMPETTFYTYDGSGHRARKRTYAATSADGITPVLRKERIYLGPLEIYREFDVDGVTPKLERETLHVLVDHRRIALIETRTLGNDPAPQQLVRYQYTNHLGSAVLELTGAAEVLSYEEYFPYGSTSYQATRNQTDLPRRYRYTGQERDEENDLDYHGARYCAPWIGRWTSTDPAGVADGTNVYLYVHCNPVAYSDPTGLWSWRTVAIVAAVVVVGAAVTVATAGLAGPAIAAGIGAAAGAVGASSAVATVATGVVVGAVAGAAGGAAGELTRQVASGEEISGRRIGQAALTGAAAGAVTGGLSSLATVRQAAGAVQAGRAATTSARVGQYTRSVARGAAHGAAGDAAAEGTRQLVSGERLDVGRIAMAGVQGAAIGGGLAAAAPVARAALSRARGGGAGAAAAEEAAASTRARRADGTPGGTPGTTQGARTPVNTRAAQAARTQNAGAGFRTQRQAARAALRDANPRSVRANREFGGVIYRTPGGRHHYTPPARGSVDGFTPNPGARPAGTTLVGDYHTHGDYSRVGPGGSVTRTSNAAQDSFNSDRFSRGVGGDIGGITADAVGRPGYRGYLGTPSGTFREFNPATGRTTTIN
ncbi:MAG TPA: SpvB/TcaC N-terminal domain-containing protein [Candidatus Dormibacteraeota bacterium]|nr:SpvB/TcaC N-terminal domain-containing protein [Candidatus Dormibacteraeota bacterium]